MNKYRIGLGSIFTVFSCLVWGGAALALDIKLKEGETRLDKSATVQLISGNTFLYQGGGWTRYGVDGSYFWQGRDNGSKWRVEDDGSVCVTFPNGKGRCDAYVQKGQDHIFVSQKGRRYPALLPASVQAKAAQ